MGFAEKRKGRDERIFCLSAGICAGSVTAAAYCFPALWWLCLGSLTPLLFCLLFKTKKKTALFGYTAALHGLTLSFFYCLTPEAEEVSRHAVFLLSLGILLASCLLGLCFFLAFLPYFIMVLKGRRMPSPAVRAIACALSYALAEWLEERLLYPPFPWVRLAAAAAPCALFLQPAAWFGSCFVSGELCLINGLATLFLWRAKKYAPDLKKERRRQLALSGCVCALLLLSGLRLWRQEKGRREEGEVSLLLVQGNFSGEEKWERSLKETEETYLLLTQAAVRENVDIVVWPETALPAVLETEPAFCLRLEAFCRLTGAKLFFGAFAVREGKRYNALYCMTEDGLAADVYYKQKLVPFGEFLPFEGLLSRVAPSLAKWLKESLGQSAGEETVLFSLKEGTVGGLICYESIFSEVARKAADKGAGLLLLPSNDSWLNGSAALSQHHAQAVLRAVETGRYVVRVGNTGITSVISPWGRVLLQAPQNRRTVLTATAAFKTEKTPYVRFGEGWLLVGIALESLCLPLYNKMENCHKNNLRGEKGEEKA